MQKNCQLFFFYIGLLVLAIAAQASLCSSGLMSTDMNADLPGLHMTVLSVEHDVVSFGIEWAKLIVNYLF